MTNPDAVTQPKFDPTNPDFTDRYVASSRMADYYKAGSVVHLGNFNMSDYVDGGDTTISVDSGMTRVVPSRGHIELGKAFDAAEDAYGKESVSYGGPIDSETDEVHDYGNEEMEEIARSENPTLLQGLYVTKEAFEKAEQEGKHYPFADSPRVELPSRPVNQKAPSRLGRFALRKRS